MPAKRQLRKRQSHSQGSSVRASQVPDQNQEPRKSSQFNPVMCTSQSQDNQVVVSITQQQYELMDKEFKCPICKCIFVENPKWLPC